MRVQWKKVFHKSTSLQVFIIFTSSTFRFLWFFYTCYPPQKTYVGLPNKMPKILHELPTMKSPNIKP